MVVKIIISCLQLTHNGSIVEIATSFNIFYDLPEDGHQIGRKMLQ
jgi:hypothetical protein